MEPCDGLFPFAGCDQLKRDGARGIAVNLKAHWPGMGGG